MTDPPPSNAAPEAEPSVQSFPVGVLLVLLAWLGLAVPVFLRMPLTNDAELFDLHVRMLKSGRILYQDILEPNLPGVIWIHAAVRAVAGASSEALRVFDLLLFAGLMVVAYRWLRLSGISRSGGTATVLSACVFYLSGSEWIHCQRDTWMLTVTFVAATLRCHSIERRGSQSAWQIGLTSMIEGLIWGIGIWIKPYVVLVAIAVWIVTARRQLSLRHLAIDGAGVLAGGLLAGIAGLGWMASTGCLTAFLEQSREWNPHYFTARSAQWTLDRFVPMAIRFLPWMLLHPLAIAVSLRRLKQALRKQNGEQSGSETQDTSLRSEVLAALYLAWCVHMFLLQHLFDYVHAPGVLLAILVTADWLSRWKHASAARFGSYAFAIAAVFTCPYLDVQRIKNWKPAVSETPTEARRDQLACFENPNRADMEQVAEFLRSKGASDGDVVCFNSDLVSLYRQLGFMPPTRFIYVNEILVYVPSAANTILEALMASGHKYVVTDVLTSGMTAAGLRELTRDGEQIPPTRLSDSEGVYPWGQPVVFRAGWYLVHEVSEESSKLHIPGTPLTAASRNVARD